MSDPVSDAMFTIVPVLVLLGFLVVGGLIVAGLVRAARTHTANSSSPERSVAATVIGKRIAMEGGGDHRVRENYHVTFQLGDGERMELQVKEAEYGLLAEGDAGTLTHQGTWYRGFERTRVIPTDGTWEPPAGPGLAPPRD